MGGWGASLGLAGAACFLTCRRGQVATVGRLRHRVTPAGDLHPGSHHLPQASSQGDRGLVSQQRLAPGLQRPERDKAFVPAEREEPPPAPGGTHRWRCRFPE